jgi:hypothetical protein
MRLAATAIMCLIFALPAAAQSLGEKAGVNL